MIPEKECPQVWRLRSGKILESPLPPFTDQALEHKKSRKGYDEMAGLKRHEAALDRQVTTSPYLGAIVNSYLNDLPKLLELQ